MQVLYSEAHVYEYLPYEVVHEGFDHLTLAELLLPLDHGIKIADRTVL